MPVYPDELVHLLSEDIAYNKGRIRLSELWQISSKYVELGDARIKEFVYSCLTSSRDVLLFRGDEVVQKDYTEVASNEDDYSIGITEDRLWVILTGYTKKECNIGGHAFDLLLEIAKSRDQGINTKDLAIATKQDPRSITGRVKKLSQLICSMQMIYKGHVVKLLKLQKYAKSGSAVKVYVNMRTHLSEIVQVVKRSKNRVRQIIDLKREFKFDQEKRLSKSFIAAISWLDEKGYLKKVLVVSPTNPSVKIRCVKYIRDYYPEDKTANDFDNDTESAEDEQLGDDRAGMDDEDAYDGLDTLNATSILQEHNLIVEDQHNVENNDILINRFYPIQNQTYDLADDAGLAGISTMQMVNKLTGRDYKRALTKSSEYYVENAGKPVKNSNGFNIIRVYDFEGKKKFYRFFTEENFSTLMGDNSAAHEAGFPPSHVAKKGLHELNETSFVALNNTLRFIRDGGQERFFWNGELKVPSNPNAPTRGRKRKYHENESLGQVEVSDQAMQDTHTKSRKNYEESPLGNGRNEVKSSLVDSSSSSKIAVNKNKKPEALNLGGFSANSLRSLWRQRAILEVVKRTGGVTYLRDQFFEDVSHFMGSRTLLDKKTVRGDVSLMLQCNKLREQIEPSTGRRIISLPDIENEAVTDYVIKQKDNKKTAFKDIIHNADLYFFDQTEKNRFHRGVNSAKRIRKFQNSAQDNEKPYETPTGERQSNRKDGKNRSKVVKSDVSGSSTNKSIHKAPVQEVSESKQGEPRTRKTFHLGNKLGARALVMAVVISKSIKNEIAWEKITRLFSHNSLDNLKKHWTSRRVKMGHSGWRAYVDKWSKILIAAIKNEEATLDDAENLDLPKLIALWMTSDDAQGRKPVSLYRDYTENRRCYTLVKDPEYSSTKVGLAMSSMVQRETYLLKKVYMYEEEQSEGPSAEDDARAVIRSLLFENPTAVKDEISALKSISKEIVDKVIMDMAKEKQVYFSGAKLEATSFVQEVLNNKGDYRNWEKSKAYGQRMKEMLEAGNGIVVSDEVLDYASWILIGLISERKIRMDAIPMAEDVTPFSYTTRRFGIRALTPPLILSPRVNDGLLERPKSIDVPSGHANSRLWIDASGSIRNDVWKSLVVIMLKDILFNPGIALSDIIIKSGHILSNKEALEICNWLLAKELIHKMPFSGYRASSIWYSLFD